MMKEVNRQNKAPRPGPELEILRIVDTRIRNFTILAEGVQGIWTHWNGKASEPCYVPVESCDGCKKGTPRRWKGYLHVIDHELRKEGFLEITPTAADTLKHYLPKEVSLRTVRISLCRSSNSPKGRLRCTVNDALQTSEQLPKERDPMETLSKLWKMDKEDGHATLKVVS